MSLLRVEAGILDGYHASRSTEDLVDTSLLSNIDDRADLLVDVMQDQQVIIQVVVDQTFKKSKSSQKLSNFEKSKKFQKSRVWLKKSS